MYNYIDKISIIAVNCLHSTCNKSDQGKTRKQEMVSIKTCKSTHKTNDPQTIQDRSSEITRNEDTKSVGLEPSANQ